MTRMASALGDTALLLPFSLAFLLYLLAVRRVGLARDFGIALAAALLVTLAAKLAFNACGAQFAELDIRSPSGHAAFAGIVYGVLACAFGAGRSTGIRAVLAVAAAALVGAIGASRVVLRVHSAEEVALGLAIGAAAVALFAILRSRADDPPLSPLIPAIGTALVMLLFLGGSVTFEHAIVRTARHLTGALDICAPPARVTDLRRTL